MALAGDAQLLWHLLRPEEEDLYWFASPVSLPTCHGGCLDINGLWEPAGRSPMPTPKPKFAWWWQEGRGCWGVLGGKVLTLTHLQVIFIAEELCRPATSDSWLSQGTLGA